VNAYRLIDKLSLGPRIIDAYSAQGFTDFAGTKVQESRKLAKTDSIVFWVALQTAKQSGVYHV